MSDFSHLNALELRLSHEREYLARERTEDGKKIRRVWMSQIEKEIELERKLLGLPDNSDEIEMSDEELLAALS